MTDLKNIALTLEAEQVAKEFRQTFGIAEQMDLIRLGFAYAIREGVDLSRASGYGTRGGSNYDVGGLDADGLMAQTVRLYYPTEDVLGEPYRAVETLMSKGLLLLSEHRREGVIGSLSDLVDQTPVDVSE